MVRTSSSQEQLGGSSLQADLSGAGSICKTVGETSTYTQPNFGKLPTFYRNLLYLAGGAFRIARKHGRRQAPARAQRRHAAEMRSLQHRTVLIRQAAAGNFLNRRGASEPHPRGQNHAREQKTRGPKKDCGKKYWTPEARSLKIWSNKSSEKARRFGTKALLFCYRLPLLRSSESTPLSDPSSRECQVRRCATTNMT